MLLKKISFFIFIFFIFSTGHAKFVKKTTFNQNKSEALLRGPASVPKSGHFYTQKVKAGKSLNELLHNVCRTTASFSIFYLNDEMYFTCIYK
jgi:hypothetical protein